MKINGKWRTLKHKVTSTLQASTKTSAQGPDPMFHAESCSFSRGELWGYAALAAQAKPPPLGTSGSTPPRKATGPLHSWTASAAVSAGGSSTFSAAALGYATVIDSAAELPSRSDAAARRAARLCDQPRAALLCADVKRRWGQGPYTGSGARPPLPQGMRGFFP
jgi:hypothetical protein